MSIGNSFASDILKLIFNATPIADLAADDQSSPATTLTVALHTSDPGEGGTQATNETAYTSYVRQTVARTSGGWAIAGGDPDPATVSPVANIDFPECTASPGGAITHFSVGTGVGNKLLWSGAISPTIAVAVGVVPRLKTTTVCTID